VTPAKQEETACESPEETVKRAMNREQPDLREILKDALVCISSCSDRLNKAQADLAAASSAFDEVRMGLQQLESR